MSKGPQTIEEICSKNSGFGEKIISCIKSITTYEFSHSLRKLINEYELELNAIQITKGTDKEFKTSYGIVVSHYNNKKKINELVEYKKIKSDNRRKEQKVIIIIPKEMTGKISIDFICEKYVGLDKTIIINDIEEAVGDKCCCNKNTINFDSKEIEKYFYLPEDTNKTIINDKIPQKDTLLSEKITLIAEEELKSQRNKSQGNEDAIYFEQITNKIEKDYNEIKTSLRRSELDLEIDEYAKLLGIDTNNEDQENISLDELFVGEDWKK